VEVHDFGASRTGDGLAQLACVLRAPKLASPFGMPCLAPEAPTMPSRIAPEAPTMRYVTPPVIVDHVQLGLPRFTAAVRATRYPTYHQRRRWPAITIAALVATAMLGFAALAIRPALLANWCGDYELACRVQGAASAVHDVFDPAARR
jgi:hypothetical protein